jgi:hypothetical protein
MKKRAVISILVFCAAFSLFSQERKRDTEFWEAFGVDITLSKIFKIYLEKQLRYENRFTNLEADLMEAGVRFRLNRTLAFRLNYRYVIRKNQKRFRFDVNGQLYFKWKLFKKLKPLRISLRTRVQREYIEDGIFNDSELELRNRLELTIRLNKKIWPYLGSELFTGLGDNARDRHKLRLTLGTEWNVKKRVTIKFYYHYQTDTVPERSELTHIFGTKFNYSF